MNMRATLLSALLLTLTLPIAAHAADTVDWTIDPPTSGTVVGGEVMIDGRGSHPLLTITRPTIGGESYAVTGSIRFEDVPEPGYLEMWSYFPDGGAYFSRTLAEEGAMAALIDDSPGREFELPFFLNGSPPPERIEVNVVLPGGGTVWIGPLQLVGFGGSTEWWSETQAGLVGAVGGTLAGLVGAVLGILGGKRSRRALVRSVLIGGIVAGGVSTTVAAVAFIGGQPRHVWWPLGLLGVILLAVDGLLLPRLRAVTEQEELHRIRALDA